MLAHPRFTHIRKRGADVRRREFRGVRWLVADMNVAPAYTLTTVEQIVTHPGTRIEGLLLTLKLIDWVLAAEVPGYLDRIRSWGFSQVAARQLAHNRQEICVAARNPNVGISGSGRCAERVKSGRIKRWHGPATSRLRASSWRGLGRLINCLHFGQIGGQRHVDGQRLGSEHAQRIRRIARRAARSGIGARRDWCA